MLSKLLVVKVSYYPIIKQITFSGCHSENLKGDNSNLWAEILQDMLNWIVKHELNNLFADTDSGAQSRVSSHNI